MKKYRYLFEANAYNAVAIVDEDDKCVVLDDLCFPNLNHLHIDFDPSEEDKEDGVERLLQALKNMDWDDAYDPDSDYTIEEIARYADLEVQDWGEITHEMAMNNWSETYWEF